MSNIAQAATFSPKDPAEIVVITFDFSEIATAVATPTITVTHKRGTADATPALMLAGAAVASGLRVQQVIQGGQAGADYILRCQVEANDGQRFVLAGTLPVRTA